jgi:YVTN family beta-propeller protein
MIDPAQSKVTRTLPLEGVPKAAQIARYSPDEKLLVVSSLNSDMVSLIDVVSGKQAAVAVGSEPMDFAFRGDEIFVGCQGDGSIHIIDVPNRRHKQNFRAGVGCESVGFF